ncbi:hypothetical protein IPH25_00215 [bacterium]|nr:MAG: hypothetical protein IPG37_02330 [bacterium]QQR61858.1 MAG: hypothetical protein IPH25_00215 [bacterium]
MFLKVTNSPVYILEVLELGNVHYALTASTFGNMLITPLEKENSGVKSFLQKHVRTFSSIKNLKNMFLLDVQKNENNGYLILYAKIMKKKKMSLIDPVFSLDVQCYLKEVKLKEDLFNLANNPGTLHSSMNGLLSDQENVPLVGFLCKETQAVVFYQKVDSVQQDRKQRTVKLFQRNNEKEQAIELCSGNFIGRRSYAGTSLNDHELCKAHLGCLMRMKADGYGLCTFKKLFISSKGSGVAQQGNILLKVNFETGQVEILEAKDYTDKVLVQYFDSAASDMYEYRAYQITKDFKKLQVG